MYMEISNFVNFSERVYSSLFYILELVGIQRQNLHYGYLKNFSTWGPGSFWQSSLSYSSFFGSVAKNSKKYVNL